MKYITTMVQVEIPMGSRCEFCRYTDNEYESCILFTDNQRFWDGSARKSEECATLLGIDIYKEPDYANHDLSPYNT